MKSSVMLLSLYNPLLEVIGTERKPSTRGENKLRGLHGRICLVSALKYTTQNLTYFYTYESGMYWHFDTLLQEPSCSQNGYRKSYLILYC